MAVLTFSIVQPDLCTCVFYVQMFNSVLGGRTKHLFPFVSDSSCWLPSGYFLTGRSGWSLHESVCLSICCSGLC